MARFHRYRERPERRSTDASRALEKARHAAGLTCADLGRALGVHARTLRRWEHGESRPREMQWTRVLAFYGARSPALAAELAQAVGRPMPALAPRPLHPRAALVVMAMAADTLEIAPKRVREVFRATLRAALEAGVSLDRLAEVVLREDPEAAHARGELRTDAFEARKAQSHQGEP